MSQTFSPKSNNDKKSKALRDYTLDWGLFILSCGEKLFAGSPCNFSALELAGEFLQMIHTGQQQYVFVCFCCMILSIKKHETEHENSKSPWFSCSVLPGHWSRSASVRSTVDGWNVPVQKREAKGLKCFGDTKTIQKPVWGVDVGTGFRCVLLRYTHVNSNHIAPFAEASPRLCSRVRNSSLMSRLHFWGRGAVMYSWWSNSLSVSMHVKIGWAMPSMSFYWNKEW